MWRMIAGPIVDRFDGEEILAVEEQHLLSKMGHRGDYGRALIGINNAILV